MLHACTDAKTTSLREDVLVTLRKGFFTYDKEKSVHKIGHIFLQLLQETDEPNVYG